MIENYNNFMSERQHSHPFIIGLFHGNNKPSNVDEYLQKFVDEVRKLQEQGFSFNGKIYFLKMSAFVCDMPARAFVKCVAGHSRYSGCDKCTQRGVYVNSVTFPECQAQLRTDESFANMSDMRHHHNLGMVSQFPIDYMHLVCLGVTRKLVYLWLKGQG